MEFRTRERLSHELKTHPRPFSRHYRARPLGDGHGAGRGKDIRGMKKYLPLFLVALLAMAAFGATIYQWIDDKGMTH